MKTLTTKENIINQAGELFALKGFNGASIRDISRACDVNIAAINYHFQSKENLFIDVVRSHYSHLEREVESISKRPIEMDVFFVQVFRMLVDHSSMVLNTFKLFMNDQVHPGDDLLLSERGTFGPPGIDFAMAKMKKDYPTINETNRFFVVKNLFFVICHSALALSCPVLKKRATKEVGYTKKDHEKNIKHLFRALITSVQKK